MHLYRWTFVSYVGENVDLVLRGNAIAHKIEQNRIITTAITHNLEEEK